MKWFRHFANCEISDNLNDLIEDFGFEGYGRYWRLIELLTQKFDGSETFFRFRTRLLRDSLGFRSEDKLRKYLVAISLQEGIKAFIIGNYVEINAPILLLLQDKDSKYNRKRIAKPSLNATLDKEVDREVDKDKEYKKEKYISSFIIKEIQLAYKTATNIGAAGPNLKKRLELIIKNEKDLKLLLSCIKNYGDSLADPENSWRKPKQTLEAFIGSKSYGFFHLDYMNPHEKVMSQHKDAQAAKPEEDIFRLIKEKGAS